MYFRIVSVILIAVLFGSPVAYATNFNNSKDAQYLDSSKIERAIDYTRIQLQKNEIIGGVIGIFNSSGLVEWEGFGVADRKKEDKPSSKTIYSIASVTKALTATAILKLNSEGLLDINKPVQTYIPWFQFQNQENYNQVTVKDLLTHAAGGIGSFETDALIYESDQAKQSLEEYNRLMTNLQLTEQPGSTGNYCNGCYDTLGLIIEYVTQMSYHKYMKEHIFMPLQMKDTVFGEDLKNMDQERIAKEYTWFFGTKMHLERSYETFGKSQDSDGGVYSTIEDLGKYLAFLLEFSNPFEITPEDMELMKLEVVSKEDNTAYYTVGGFEAKKLHQTDIYYKSGDGVGSATAILFIPEYDYGLALLLGELHPEIIQQMIEDVASILMGYDPVAPEASLTIGKLIGYIVWLLVAVSMILLILLVRRLYKRNVSNIKLWRSILGTIVYGSFAFFLWTLLVTVRPSPIGFYGYPYDLAIGLIFMSVMLSLWFMYYLLDLLIRIWRSVRVRRSFSY